MQNKITWVVLLLLVMVPVSMGNWGLTESSEARYAEISREMYLTGNLLEPKLLGIKHFHKPPVTYYLTAIAYSLFGINEYAVRFFPAVALFLQLFFLFLCARMLSANRETALVSVVLYFSYAIGHIAAVNLTTDGFLTTFIFGAIFFFLKYHHRSKVHFLYLFYIFCGFAFLTKGPVGVLPQAVFAIAYNLLHKKERRFSRHHVFAALACLLVSISWFALLLYHDPNLGNYFLKHQLVDRVANDSFARTKPFWYYLALMPIAGLPAILLFFDYCRKAILKGRLPSSEKALFISLSVCLLVFSLSSSKLILYVLPLYFFIAILSAMHAETLPPARLRFFRNIFFYFNGILFLLLLAVALVSFPGWTIPVLPVILASFSGVVLLMIVRFKLQLPAVLSMAICASLGVAVLRFVLPFVLKENEANVNSIKPLVKVLKHKMMLDSIPIIVYDQLLPSFAFYTNRKFVSIYNDNNKAKREIQFEKPGSDFENSYFEVRRDYSSASFRALGEDSTRVIIASVNHDLPDSLSFLRRELSQKDTFGNWVYYYKPHSTK